MSIKGSERFPKQNRYLNIKVGICGGFYERNKKVC